MSDRKEYHKKYYQEHREEYATRGKKRQTEHPEYLKNYYANHCEKAKKDAQENRGRNREKLKETRKKYTQTPAGKKAIRKDRHKRRQFGFTPLNEYFENSAGHHIDKEFVIHVPAEMHEFNRHSILANRNMNVINALAFNWLEAEELYAQAGV